KAGNGNEYQLYTCEDCSFPDAAYNPKMSAEREKEADEMREKLVAAREKKQLDEADQIAQEGLKKGYVLFYNELATTAGERENVPGKPPIPFRESQEKEWMIKGAEHGSNASVETLFRLFNGISSQKGSPRSDIMEAWFWGYIGITSGIILDDDADWLTTKKRITPKEKADTLARANEWMKQHNWPAITR
ncbi:MAG TPA: hypothetical protein VFM46_06725, partial [Pseudomonadales bacterium]|nr:hypothetical protein [Pseudomonadales bacterium]